MSILKNMVGKIEIEQVSVETLIPYARNSRTHSEEQVSQIAGSIREFGFTNPVLIGADNGIIAGHGRLMAARKLGLEEIPCIRLGHLTETQKRAYVIADNKLAVNAGWDEELLKLELCSLQDDGIDFLLTGFSEAEFSILLKDANETEGTEDPREGVLIHSVFEVVAECEHEDQQRMVYNILNEKGVKCRLSTL
jgi:ParB-like chromosome segregation protein Spo0J